jgi:hypothetical protein
MMSAREHIVEAQRLLNVWDSKEEYNEPDAYEILTAAKIHVSIADVIERIGIPDLPNGTASLRLVPKLEPPNA